MAALAWLLVGGGAVAVCARTKAGVRTVTIDAGHGGKDPGTLGPNSKEKDVTLAVALRLGEKIRAKHPEVKVIYTRDKDEFIPLDERSAIANVAKSDLFISIHCNSAGATVAKGVETFVMGWHMAEDQFEVAKRENSVITFEQDYSQKYNHFDPNSPESYIIFSLMQNVFHDQSIEFATLVQQNFVKKNNRFDR
ncbi:MAG: N-acetylmuramoyl-L-alanine amidase, partial [Bacteroidia bacterium]|nr:N-acetylmuramoyl-L-alanine amidase [Bacteroidia bacterium]